MPAPIGDVDKHGLSTLARSWTPKGMVREDAGRRFMEAIADCLADSLNPIIEFEQFIPLLLNPHRCTDEQLATILALNGVEVPRGTMSVVKLRRLASLAPDLKAWRGAFRSHRTVVSALTGGPVVVLSWIAIRAVINETSLDWTLLDQEDDPDNTIIFCLGQGPSSDYNEAEVTERLDAMAKPILDHIQLVPCFALTAWRNGLSGWDVTGSPVLVDSGIQDEFEAVELGPGVSADPVFVLRTPTEAPEVTDTASIWETVYFKYNDDITYGDSWDLAVFTDASDYAGSAYLLRVPVGSGTPMLKKIIGGVTSALASGSALVVGPGYGGEYHRAEIIVQRSATGTLVKGYIDGDLVVYFLDTTLVNRPSGTHGFIGLAAARFTTGKLRLSAITARRNDL